MSANEAVGKAADHLDVETEPRARPSVGLEENVQVVPSLVERSSWPATSTSTRSPSLPVDLAAQLLPGTFEHALHHLLEHAIDLTPFDARYRNDTTGAPAYPPAMLLRWCSSPTPAGSSAAGRSPEPAKTT
jgi:hypothetical protein